MTKKEKEERTCRWMLTVPCRIIQAEKKKQKTKRKAKQKTNTKDYRPDPNTKRGVQT
jgi:hypothetical protein